MSAKVVIVQRRLTHYRVPLFSLLREMLGPHNIHLELLVGSGTEAEEKKRDSGDLSWAKKIPTHYYADGRLCWQALGAHLAGADLVIITQENKLLYNHWLVFRPRSFLLAFWGHGGNLQSSAPNGLKETFKRWTTARVDWWFAYTEISASFIRRTRFPEGRITVLNNAIDTSSLQSHCASIKPQERSTLLDLIGFEGIQVGIFVGSLYPEKRLDFLFAAADSIRRQLPAFELLLVGDGPESEAVQAWCASRPWTHWAGVRLGREKSAYMSLGTVMLNPGLVGLGILDSFACQVPMITTDCGIHSPEVAYLENNVNGVMTPNSPEEYVGAVVRLLTDARAIASLKQGCAQSAGRYTNTQMAEQFARGIREVLAGKQK